jgi:hypothetical protein
MPLNRTLAALAFLASATVIVMVAAIVATGFSQQIFELAPSPAFVADQLREPVHALGLRINLGLDNLFIVVYSAFFVFLAVRARGSDPHRVARCRREPPHFADAARFSARRADLGG